jgi:hypothetical protein
MSRYRIIDPMLARKPTRDMRIFGRTRASGVMTRIIITAVTDTEVIGRVHQHGHEMRLMFWDWVPWLNDLSACVEDGTLIAVRVSEKH